jgi:hypothetical protein
VVFNYKLPINNYKLLHFFVRCVLAAPVAELLQFQTVRRRFAVLGRRIVPLFAITTLQRNNLSGHCSLPWFQSSLRDFTLLSSLHPALKRWAIIGRPYGAVSVPAIRHTFFLTADS